MKTIKCWKVKLLLPKIVLPTSLGNGRAQVRFEVVANPISRGCSMARKEPCAIANESSRCEEVLESAVRVVETKSERERQIARPRGESAEPSLTSIDAVLLL